MLDNGIGMSAAVIDKVMKQELFSVGKEGGHGLGLSQVQQTLQYYHGQMKITSAPETGTQVSLHFPKCKTPGWIADHLDCSTDDIVIILDDDASIHTAWNHRLKEVVEQSKALDIIHFKEGQAVLEYYASLEEPLKKRIFLLTDYELLKQPLNGLDVVEQINAHRAILVTSHYTNVEVVKRAALLGTKILPKLLVAEIPIQLKEKAFVENTIGSPFELVIIDDKSQFMQVLIKHYLKGKKVKLYDDPYLFLAEYKQFSKSTPICLHDDLGLPELNGRTLAERLHQEGFENLYLISGNHFKDLPPYLKAISKNEIGNVRLGFMTGQIQVPEDFNQMNY